MPHKRDYLSSVLLKLKDFKVLFGAVSFYSYGCCLNGIVSNTVTLVLDQFSSKLEKLI